MLKALKRFLILLVIFILGVAGTVFLMNNETTDDRSDMNNPTLPEVLDYSYPNGHRSFRCSSETPCRPLPV